ncbi:MAG: hypothetical protein EZS28_024387 [Streblomastix strix]|uniref:RNase H type-1 domain-containing protein n=1 Tax=Streblomastix strix TaxID=222440 RepID=A0A5J4VC10_9EUKA|nr:MAG: hypothetical protein EZS28_024387 [Streblomastix strix]
MATQSTTLNAIHSYLGNEPIGEMLLHIYKLLVWATDYSQKIREKINVHGSDKDMVDGVTSSKDVLSDDSRQRIEEKDKAKLLENVKSLIMMMTQQQQQQQRNNLNGVNRQRWEGWDKVTILQKFIRRNIRWWKKQLEFNIPASLIILSPQAQLITDASAQGLGRVLQLQNEEEIMVHGVWARNWRLAPSNQRETASILCCLRIFESTVHNRQILALEILTDSTTTAYRIRKQATVETLVTLTQTILEWAEANKIQLSTICLPGIANKVADSLSKLNRAGDYYIAKLKAQRILKYLNVTATIDVFSTRSNRIVQRYCSPRMDSRTVA